MVDTYPQLQQTEVDGVPTFWLKGIAGPRRAALMSRVGRADEPLARSGITHLVEHLVLAPLGVQDYDHNGMVEDVCLRHARDRRPGHSSELIAQTCAACLDP